LLVRWLCTQGANQDQLLAVATIVTSKIREAVRKETGFTCSAGISPKKVSKYALGMISFVLVYSIGCTYFDPFTIKYRGMCM